MAETVVIQPSSESARFTTGPDIVPVRSATQGAVDRLENITSVDMALAVPFIEIVRVDPGTRSPLEGAEPLNVFFQRPPEFGVAMSDRGRFAERPAVSLQSLKVSTEQDFGPLILQYVEMTIVVHRPDALFDDPSSSAWKSIITPGESHIVRYGWKGASKNELVNGETYTERVGERVVSVDSIKSILFTTYYYTFTYMHNGEIEIVVKGRQNGDFALRKMLVADIDKEHERLNLGREESAKNPEQVKLTAKSSTALRKVLQSKMTELEENSAILDKKSKNVRVRIVDVADKMIAPTIARRAKQWGYDHVELLIGNFNDRCGSTTEKYGGSDMGGKSIGDFELPVDAVKKILKDASVVGSEVTMRNFMSTLFNSVTEGSAWAAADSADGLLPVLPTIGIRVTDKTYKGKRVLSVIVMDITQELVRFDPSDKLEPDAKTGKISRERIKKKIREKDVPYVTFGQGLSYIKDATFEVVMDNQIQRAKIEAALQHVKSRGQITGQTDAEVGKSMPENFHELWQSTLRGEITMLGNFVFDVFSYAWVDFGVAVWNGLFSIRQRTDVVTAAAFETAIELYTEGGDPLNVIAMKSAERLQKEKEYRSALEERRRARGKDAVRRADARVRKAEQALKSAR